MPEIKDFLADIKDPNVKALAELYLPVVSRWAKKEGWDLVRLWLYDEKQIQERGKASWYAEILSRMTAVEHEAEDARRLEVLKRTAVVNSIRIRRERAILQALITTVIGKLLGSI